MRNAAEEGHSSGRKIYLHCGPVGMSEMYSSML